jgi:sterol desaturase/sphingolipid hydroxylase (fatty acid hydroxylase superfamily)
MAVLNALVRYGYAPFMILGLNGAAFWIVTQGYSYAWLAPLLIVAFASAHLAERVAPWYEEWNDPAHDHHDNAANIWHIIVYEISNVNGLLLIPVIVWLFPFQGIWPDAWPVLAQWLMAIVIADFGFMFVHMISHHVPMLWRLHAVHHGVGRLYGMNGLVRHPLHQTLDMIVATAPLVILGMPVDVAVLLGFSVSIMLIVQHSNVAYALGPFRNHLSIGRIHHLHHVNWGKEGDCNFGLFFTLWDRVFGTFQAEPPRAIQAHDMGIDEVPNFPKSYLEQLLFPFVYKPGAGEPERYKAKNGEAKPQKLTPAQEARRIVDAAE